MPADVNPRVAEAKKRHSDFRKQREEDIARILKDGPQHEDEIKRRNLVQVISFTETNPDLRGNFLGDLTREHPYDSLLSMVAWELDNRELLLDNQDAAGVLGIKRDAIEDLAGLLGRASLDEAKRNNTEVGCPSPRCTIAN